MNITTLRFIITALATTVLLLSGTTAFAQNSSEEQVQEMYIAYYGRPGDPAGIDYWSQRLVDESGRLDVIIDDFGTSEEYIERFSALDDETLLNNIYLSLFGRDADAAGLAFYRSGLSSGEMTLASIALNISDGVQTGSDDEAIVLNKIAVAEAYTAAVSANEFDYGGDQIEAAVALMSSVGSSDASLEAALVSIAGIGESIVDASSWIINTATRSTQIFESATTNLGVLEDVQAVAEQSINSVDYVYVQASGIPKYDIEFTQEILDDLNNRPRAGTDFGAGVTSATLGQTVVFGEDIGFSSSNENCNATGGAGYWPPGPGCPIDVGKAEYLPADPTPNSAQCEAGLGTTGLMVNGTSVFGWGDGMSHGNNIWYNLAPIAEQYDVDVCGGHAAQGEYHHHFYTSCLADLVADKADDHSPIYGFAADGYPLYGPYESSGVLAVSGWQARDYGAADNAGGCATPGERTCVLVDEYDVSQGVDFTVDQGPDIGETVTTLSGNSLSAVAGYYLEDYYYTGATAAGSQLDQHNGHDNLDGRGYHYHITLVDDGDGKLTPSFPFTMGPRFFGELPDNAMTACGGAGGGAGGGPPLGGGPPSGGG
jgi:hypothetical protein